MPTRPAKLPNHWSGRFQSAIDPLALDFTQSVAFDKKLYYYDILGSMAHARALQRARLLSPVEAKKIRQALAKIAQEIGAGKLEFREELEDVHRNIESFLQKRLGTLGGKLHTGRSRNDQVALDFRLYCRDRLTELHDSLLRLERVTLRKAKAHLDLVMPGYTHLQRAQPVLFSHHLLAYLEMWERDRSRLLDAFRRLNCSPLGAGALAGTAFPLDRESAAREMGCSGVTHNSLDAVSDRDFAIEIAAAASILMMHLSRLCEELILWSSSEFGFVELPQSFCTGSSMMPQKINPDIPELIRGKTGRVYGCLIALLTVMKGLPLSYNKDLQEDKEAIFDLFETVINCVDILAALIGKTKPNRARMREAVSDELLYATDLADELVRRGVAFRTAHEIVARLVRHAQTRRQPLSALSLAEWKRFSPKFDQSFFRLLRPEASIAARRVTGGTARQSVQKEIRRLEKVLF